MSIAPRCLLSFMAIAMCMVCESLGQQPKVITNSIGMELVLIPKGKFMMGTLRVFAPSREFVRGLWASYRAAFHDRDCRTTMGRNVEPLSSTALARS